MFSKDKVKGFIIGAATTSLILSGSAAFADPVSKSITAVYNGIKIVVNGNQVTPKDSDGNIVEPFVYDGTTYLPVRAVAQALNQAVDWDGSSSTVYVGTKPQGKGTLLSTLDYARTESADRINMNGWDGRHSPRWTNDVFKIAGTQYSSGIGLNGSGTNTAYIMYNLNSQYKKLTGVFGTDDIEKNDGKDDNILVIYGDGKEIYRSPKMMPGDKAVDVSIDITGVNQLKITFDTTNGYAPVFANASVQ